MTLGKRTSVVRTTEGGQARGERAAAPGGRAPKRVKKSATLSALFGRLSDSTAGSPAAPKTPSASAPTAFEAAEDVRPTTTPTTAGVPKIRKTGGGKRPRARRVPGARTSAPRKRRKTPKMSRTESVVSRPSLPTPPQPPARAQPQPGNGRDADRRRRSQPAKVESPRTSVDGNAAPPPPTPLSSSAPRPPPPPPPPPPSPPLSSLRETTETTRTRDVASTVERRKSAAGAPPSSLVTPRSGDNVRANGTDEGGAGGGGDGLGATSITTLRIEYESRTTSSRIALEIKRLASEVRVGVADVRRSLASGSRRAAAPYAVRELKSKARRILELRAELARTEATLRGYHSVANAVSASQDRVERRDASLRHNGAGGGVGSGDAQVVCEYAEKQRQVILDSVSGRSGRSVVVVKSDFCSVCGVSLVLHASISCNVCPMCGVARQIGASHTDMANEAAMIKSRVRRSASRKAKKTAAFVAAEEMAASATILSARHSYYGRRRRRRREHGDAAGDASAVEAPHVSGNDGGGGGGGGGDARAHSLAAAAPVSGVPPTLLPSATGSEVVTAAAAAAAAAADPACDGRPVVSSSTLPCFPVTARGAPRPVRRVRPRAARKVSHGPRVGRYERFVSQFLQTRATPPDHVMECVLRRLREEGCSEDSRSLNVVIETVLAENDMTSFSSMTSRIRRIATGEQVPVFDAMTVGRLVRRYVEVLRDFDRTASTTGRREKMMRHDYLTRAFLVQEGKVQAAKCFENLKTREVLRSEDDIFCGICVRLDAVEAGGFRWPFRRNS